MEKPKTKNQKQRTGFTLIEILVVVGILGIIVSLGTSMFFWVLKGSAKSRAIAEVKQNGSYALNVMERMIRNAQSLELLGFSGAEISIVNPDGGTTEFSCEDFGSGNKIASGGASLINADVVVSDCNGFFTVDAGVEGVRPARVDINFTLTKAGSPVRIEDQAAADFQTTVVLRNF